jgi:glycosyltransferase involved in cell wall biosynthesis/predicted metal-dependent phosphoesterase TrpH
VADLARCDLHVHSRYSTDSGNYALRRARLGESYTDPERVYRVCRLRGMRYVTISDHNTLEGALRIGHLPGTFLSVEVTTRFEEDDVPLHVLVWNLAEDDHRDLQPYRGSVVELAAFLRERELAHALAHPLYRMGPPLTAAHVERLMLLFSVWEGRNGARPEATNTLACRLAGSASQESLAKLAERHGVDPPAHARIGLSAGSDDHGALDIATTWTTAPGDSPTSFLTAVTAGGGEPGGAHGSTVKLAHALGALALNAYREAGHPLAGGIGDTFAGLFDDDADDAGARHEEIRTASRSLSRLLGSRARRGGVDLGRLDSLGPRLSALVAAGALQLPYLGTSHHHAGSCADVTGIESAFFGERDGRELDAIVFTDTFDEANGVAGTMRRLASEASRGNLPLRVASARAEAAAEPGLTVFAHDWAFPLPTYELLELRFPLATDVLAFVEEQRPRVIHVATPGPVGACGLIAARLLDLPVVGSYHTELGPYALHLTRDLLVAQAMDVWVDWFYRQCGLVLAPTRSIADALQARGHQRVAVWGRGVDTDRFAPRRRDDELREHLLGDGDVLLLSVGRLSEEKRVGVLLEAFRRLRETSPEARLAVVGDGPARKDLEAAAPPGVAFLGELRDDALAQVYASADLFCFPSTTDTFGQVILEACASGLPVVAAAAGGALELVRDGRNGLLVPANDPSALTRALSDLVSGAELRNALREGALAFATERSWSRADAELLAGYHTVLGPTEGARAAALAA